MRGADKGLGLGLIALLPICCVGLPLLLAAGISLAAFAWGGAVLAGVVAVAALSVVLLRRRARASACRAPADPREPQTIPFPEEVVKR